MIFHLGGFPISKNTSKRRSGGFRVLPFRILSCVKDVWVSGVRVSGLTRIYGV